MVGPVKVHVRIDDDAAQCLRRHVRILNQGSQDSIVGPAITRFDLLRAHCQVAHIPDLIMYLQHVHQASVEP